MQTACIALNSFVPITKSMPKQGVDILIQTVLGLQGGQSGDKVMEGVAGIWSFKLLQLTVGELDFSADDGFLEAILSFIVSIPTADIWQVRHHCCDVIPHA